jgi:hypothetical protein
LLFFCFGLKLFFTHFSLFGREISLFLKKKGDIPQFKRYETPWAPIFDEDEDTIMAPYNDTICW